MTVSRSPERQPASNDDSFTFASKSFRTEASSRGEPRAHCCSLLHGAAEQNEQKKLTSWCSFMRAFSFSSLRFCTAFMRRWTSLRCTSEYRRAKWKTCSRRSCGTEVVSSAEGATESATTCSLVATFARRRRIARDSCASEPSLITPARWSMRTASWRRRTARTAIFSTSKKLMLRPEMSPWKCGIRTVE